MENRLSQHGPHLPRPNICRRSFCFPRHSRIGLRHLSAGFQRRAAAVDLHGSERWRLLEAEKRSCKAGKGHHALSRQPIARALWMLYNGNNVRQQSACRRPKLLTTRISQSHTKSANSWNDTFDNGPRAQRKRAAVYTAARKAQAEFGAWDLAHARLPPTPPSTKLGDQSPGLRRAAGPPP